MQEERLTSCIGEMGVVACYILMKRNSGKLLNQDRHWKVGVGTGRKLEPGVPPYSRTPDYPKAVSQSGQSLRNFGRCGYPDKMAVHMQGHIPCSNKVIMVKLLVPNFERYWDWIPSDTICFCCHTSVFKSSVITWDVLHLKDCCCKTLHNIFSARYW